MSKIISNKGYIGLGLQAVKGTIAASSAHFVKYQDDAFTTEFETTPLREGGDDENIGGVVKNIHMEKWAFTARLRPELALYLYGWLLGQDTKTGVSDPYTHELERLSDGRKWMTIRRKLDTNIIQTLIDCKIEKLTLEAEAGKEWVISAEGMGLTQAEENVEEVPVYEDSIPFIFYHSQDLFKINTVITNDIKKVTIVYTVSSQEGLQTDSILIADLPDLKVDIDFSCELYAETIEDFFKKVNYNNTATPSESLYSFSFSMDNLFTETLADDREFKVEIGKIIANPVTGINLKGEPEAQIQTLAGIGIIPDSGDQFKVTIKNGVSTNIITGS